MRAALLLLVGLPLLLPFYGGPHRLTSSDVEHALRTQMNGRAGGHNTRRVDCTALGRPAAGRGQVRYACVLTSFRGSHARAFVVVSGGSWRAEWAPIQG